MACGVEQMKVDIFSGFLGAGKTTFIKRLLETSIGKEKVVLIENEFGEIGIDGSFLKDAGIEITEDVGDLKEKVLSSIDRMEERMREKIEEKGFNIVVNKNKFNLLKKLYE